MPKQNCRPSSSTLPARIIPPKLLDLIKELNDEARREDPVKIAAFTAKKLEASAPGAGNTRGDNRRGRGRGRGQQARGGANTPLTPPPTPAPLNTPLPVEDCTSCGKAHP